MLKQTIQYKGHDQLTKNKTLYFNLTRYEVAHDMELEKLEKRFKDFQENVVMDEERQMTPPEVREMLDIVKVMIKHAYGVRSADGQRFSKKEEHWDEFVETGAFDGFIWYLFEDPKRANVFMQGIWPEEIREAAQKVRQERPDVRPVEDVPLPGNVGEEASDDNIPSIEDNTPPDLHVVDDSVENKQWWEYSREELLQMDSTEFETLYAESAQGKNVPQMLLTIRQTRKQRGESE